MDGNELPNQEGQSPTGQTPTVPQPPVATAPQPMQPAPPQEPQPQVQATVQQESPGQPPVAPQPPSPKKNTVMIIAVVFLVFAALAVGGYLLVNKGMFVGQKACTEEAMICPDGTSVGRVGPNCEFAPCPTPQEEADPTADWELYTSRELGFSLKYPAEVEVEEDDVNKTVLFTVLGPTQAEGTEFFDGISLSVSTGSLGGKTLASFVAEDVVDESDGISEIVSGPEQVEIAGLSGYKLRVSGLGEFDYYFFLKPDGDYLRIVNSSYDPAGRGYLETVETMLGTLKLLEAL